MSSRIGAVPVCSEPNWRVAGPLLGEGEEAYGLNWHPTRELITHLPIQMPIRPEDFRGEPLPGPRIPLDPMPQPSDLAFRGEWTFQEETTLHGVAYWFEMEVVPGEWLTNEPGKEPGSWGYLYLPLDQAWRIAPGEAFQISIAPETTDSGGPGWLTWTAESGDRRFLGHEFRSVVADPKDIIAASDSWRPRLGVEGEFARRSYELADGSRTLGDIVQVLAAETGLDQIEVSKRVRDLLADHTVPPEA